MLTMLNGPVQFPGIFHIFHLFLVKRRQKKEKMVPKRGKINVDNVKWTSSISRHFPYFSSFSGKEKTKKGKNGAKKGKN